MARQYKFGEPSKLINVRVPQSRVTEFRKIIQAAIDGHYNGEEGEDYETPFRRLYDIMTLYFKPKTSISADVLEEVVTMEEMLDGKKII